MIKFKHQKDKERFLEMHPMTLRILFHAYQWAHSRKIPFVVTSTLSTKEEDELLKRVSTAHRTGRAFDLSIRGWTTDDIDDFHMDFEKAYGKWGAVSKRDLIRRCVVIKRDHIHVQISWEFVNFKNFKYV